MKRPEERTSKDEFLDYLTDTVIPNLQESGYNETAKDFMTAVCLLDWTKATFSEYLAKTLIPDLHSFKQHQTARDFTTALRFLRED